MKTVIPNGTGVSLRHSLWLIVGFLIVGFSLGACGTDLNKNLGKIRRVQTVSIVASPPEIGPGGTVTVTATSVNPDNWETAQDEIVYYWVFFHLDPDASLDVSLDVMSLSLTELTEVLEDCPDIDGCEFEIRPGNPFTFTVPDRSPGADGFFSYSVFLLVADSDATLQLLLNGEEMAGLYDLAAKGIRVTEAQTRNRNPVIEDMSVPDAISRDMTTGRYRVSPEQDLTLSATASDPDGDDIAFRWWIIDGRLEDNNRETVQWKSPESPGEYPVYLVVRDKIGDEPKGGQVAEKMVIEVIE